MEACIKGRDGCREERERGSDARRRKADKVKRGEAQCSCCSKSKNMDGLRLQHQSKAPPPGRQVPKDTLMSHFSLPRYLTRTGPGHAPLAFSRLATESRDATRPVTAAADIPEEKSFVDKDREQLCGAEKGHFFPSANG